MSMQLQPVDKEPAVLVSQPAWTEAEVRALKDQVAKDATETEFKLFLYTATQRGLNPLLKQIYCIHRGGKMTIQTSIDGYRLIANRTKKLKGIERGVEYDANGDIAYGWAKVWRKDWDHPVHEKVSFKEYTSGQGNWVKMPETMIKKVAEASALRMAFPEDLSGLYTHDEMDQENRNGPVSHQEMVEVQEWVAQVEDKRRTAKAILQDIKNIQEQEGLTNDEIAFVTGLETFKGINEIEVLEKVLETLIEHVEAKKRISAGG